MHFIPSTKVWWVSRYNDVVHVLGDPRFGRAPPGEMRKQASTDIPPELSNIAEIPPNMLYLNPPEHTRLRSLANSAFTEGLVNDMRLPIANIAERLLVDCEPKRRMELIGDFAFPLPMLVIAKLLGVPAADLDSFRRWSRLIILSLDETQPREIRLDAMGARIDFVAYLEGQIERRRRSGEGFLLDGLLGAGSAGNRLSTAELLSMCVLLLIAGQENVTNVLGCGTLELLKDRTQLEALRDSPELPSSAVDELLRYVSPVQRTMRYALEDVELGGKLLRKGERVFAILGAANRDPRVFQDPDRLDLTRSRNLHVAFGKGIHFCLGAPLAKLELAVGFGEILRRLPKIGLAGPYEWKSGTAVRGLSRLELRF